MAVRQPALTAWTRLPPMRYPSRYVWFVFFSSLDIVLTWIILLAGGSEVNPVARLVIDAWDLPGAIAFKFALTLFVIMMCEGVGRATDFKGSALATAAVMIAAFPVVYSLLLLTLHRPVFT
jgi:hypothetical protein